MPGACVLWPGKRFARGYGYLYRGGKKLLAHRFVYEQAKGPIPPTLVLDHLCENPPCVNPDHLEPKTQAEHVMRGASPIAENARKTHCTAGHPYDEANTYFTRSPGRARQRRCRECNRQRCRAAHARRKLAMQERAA